MAKAQCVAPRNSDWSEENLKDEFSCKEKWQGQIRTESVWEQLLGELQAVDELRKGWLKLVILKGDLANGVIFQGDQPWSSQELTASLSILLH